MELLRGAMGWTATLVPVSDFVDDLASAVSNTQDITFKANTGVARSIGVVTFTSSGGGRGF